MQETAAPGAALRQLLAVALSAAASALAAAPAAALPTVAAALLGWATQHTQPRPCRPFYEMLIEGVHAEPTSCPS
jgi:hypothetical protein